MSQREDSAPKRRRIQDDDEGDSNEEDNGGEVSAIASEEAGNDTFDDDNKKENEEESIAEEAEAIGTSNDRSSRKVRRSRQERLAAELADLKEMQQTYFPGDANYEGIHGTTAVDDDGNENDEEEDDGDYQAPPDKDDDANENFDAYEDENFLPEEDEGEGEDLLENQFQDYQRIETLDTYGKEGIDDRDYANIGAEERAAAEAELNRREEEERRMNGGRAGGFYDRLSVYDVEEDDEARKARRGHFRTRRRDAAAEGGEDEDKPTDGVVEEDIEETEEDILDDEVNLEAFDVPLKEWIAQDRTRREVQRKFRKFLMTFTEDDEDDIIGDDQGGYGDNNANNNSGRLKKKKRSKQMPFYEERIRNMCSSNLATLQISYLHLMQKEPILAIWIADAPRDMLDVLNETATRHTLFLFNSYGSIQDEIHVRISDMPIMDSLRALRRTHLDRLVKVSGVVTRRSAVYPQLKLAYYDCMKCKYTMGPYRVHESSVTANSTPGSSSSSKDAADLHQPGHCPDCDSEGPFRLNSSKTQYRNYQRVNLQETPGSVPPGRVPRTKEVILTNDLIDMARPGEEVEITGIYCHSYDYHLTHKSGFPIFSTFITANHLRRKEDVTSVDNLSEADKAQILELARDPNIGERIIHSIAPSIYGHKHTKTALAMSLFGAVPKNISEKHRIRGDVNVLLLGDPGTAKSQMLKYAESTAPRAVYSTGKGASAVGLTASVHKDPMTKEWTLEGGALVLADQGVCLIDEFDKMNEQDRTSIHEAMEQQSISVSKAGIVTSLQARCAVIAAANPIGGRYDSSCTLAENVELTDPILQRFDVLCVMQDTVDPVADERLAKFVTGSHMRSVPTSDVARGVVSVAEDGVTINDEYNGQKLSEDGTLSSRRIKPIPQELLRKYIQYARTNIKPILRGNTFDQEKIASLYVALRRESASSGGVPIAVRHIESIMRMAEAHAKMHLREYVRDDDMDASIGTMLNSFIAAQKFSVKRQLQRNFAKYISSGEDRAHLLLHILQDMMRNEAMYQTIRLRQRGQQVEDSTVLGILEVPLEEFESRARDRRIYDVTDFCTGEAFRDAGYLFDQRRGLISRDSARI